MDDDMNSREIVLPFPPLPDDGKKRFVWQSAEWWEWFTAFRRKPSVTAIYRRLREYDSFVSFHSGRPVDVQAYYKNGLQLADVQKLNQQARDRLLSDRAPEITRDILEAAIAKASTYHDKTLFLVLDAREISGHYLIYGSEHICGIAASLVRQVGFDCRQLLKHFGTPTVFRVDLSRAIIPEDQLRAWARHLREWTWESRRDPHPPCIDWSFILKQSIPAEHILDHVHPDRIPDPLLFGTIYTYRDNFPCFV